VGYNHPCMSFVYNCISLLIVFLNLCMLVVGSVAYIYTCGLLVYRGEVLFWIFVFLCIYLCLV